MESKIIAGDDVMQAVVWWGKVVGDYLLAYCWNSGASPVGDSSLSLLSSRNRHRQYYFVFTLNYFEIPVGIILTLIAQHVFPVRKFNSNLQTK